MNQLHEYLKTIIRSGFILTFSGSFHLSPSSKLTSSAGPSISSKILGGKDEKKQSRIIKSDPSNALKKDLSQVTKSELGEILAAPSISNLLDFAIPWIVTPQDEQLTPKPVETSSAASTAELSSVATTTSATPDNLRKKPFRYDNI